VCYPRIQYSLPAPSENMGVGIMPLVSCTDTPKIHKRLRFVRARQLQAGAARSPAAARRAHGDRTHAVAHVQRPDKPEPFVDLRVSVWEIKGIIPTPIISEWVGTLY
jgi:hypothetical protein